MTPRRVLKDALAYEQALLQIYKYYVPQECPEIEKAFRKYAKESEGRLLELRKFLYQYCGG